MPATTTSHPAIDGALTGDRQRRPQPHRSRRAWGLTLAVAVIGVGATVALAARSTPSPSNEVAPVFALDNLNDGGKVTLNPGPTLVNFWASWCRPCRKEMPLLQRTHRRVGTAVRFVGIDTKDQDDAATAFLRSTGVTYDIGIDKTGDVAGRYHVIGLPTTVLVGADGRVRGRVVGRLSENKLRRLLDLTTRG